MTEQEIEQLIDRKLRERELPDHSHTLDKIEHSNLLGLGNDGHARYLDKDGSKAFTGEQSMGTNKLTNVVDPTADQDAATKKYVDDNETPKVAFEFSTIFENIDRFKDFDEAVGAGPINDGGFRLDVPATNRSKGIEIENFVTGFDVFGNGKTVEFSIILDTFDDGITGQRDTDFYMVVGDLTGAAAPTTTNNHFGFLIWVRQDTVSVFSTQANGTSQDTNSITGGAAYKPHIFLRAVYDGTDLKYYLDGTLSGTRTLYKPTVDAAGHFMTLIAVSPGTDDSGNSITFNIGSFNYKQYE